ncbi:MAG: hypothetical protein COW71_05000 [Ignavibacteriales bacterium CG18_big_fil_WC_8_21_14_2_50_31_20]|nr:MAG: hypothetical protein COW71_05000 [Ignavibacteriales bacterium CG18_big_fil_WC_8_21_14_2_50_31_20]
MKKLYLLILLGFFASNLFAQSYPEVSIRDIQYQTNEALLTAGAAHSEPKPALAVSGDTVIVTGVVMCAPYEGANPDSTRTLHSGAAAVFLQDPNDREWSGILVRDPEASGSFAILDTGLIVKFKTTVTEYYTTTQLTAVDFQASDIIGMQARPKPVILTLDSLVEKGSSNPNYLAEKWENVYVEFQNVTATDPAIIGYNTYKIFDENNSAIIVGNNSDYYRRTPAPLPGTKLLKIRGYIETRTNITGGWFMINPVYEDDVVYGEVFPPNISDVVRDLAEVKYGDNVKVSATLTDRDGTIGSAQVIYSIDEVRQTPVSMSADNDSVWSATIPALNDSAFVSYFVKAYDNEGNVSYSPTDTVNGKYFYFVLDRPLTIKDVQYSPYGSGYSGYHNYTVTVEGVVTSSVTDIPGDGSTGAQVYIQNGIGAWSGIQIFGTQTETLVRNDKVSVTGIVNETFGVTRIGNLDQGVQVAVLGNDGVGPEPTAVETAIVGASRGGVLPAESYEGVLIKYSNVSVIDENADGGVGPNASGSNSNFGEMLVADGTGVGTRVELQDGGNNYHNFWDATLENEPVRVLEAAKFDELVGVLYFSFSNFKLIPRTDDDFVGYTDVEENIEIPEVFSLSQNYPNPFNPTTVISYSIPQVTNVKLKVFDMLGREIATIVNKEQNAGVYNVQFNAANLSSGVYFYRIEAGSFVASKKLLLLK